MDSAPWQGAGRTGPNQGQTKAKLLNISLLILLALLSGCASHPKIAGPAWPRYRLVATQVTLLNSPEGGRFDASGLLLTRSGDLLTMRNNHDSQLYRVDLLPGGTEARLEPLPGCFTPDQLAALAGDRKPFDCEGLAQDDQGRFYLCEEPRRWILRCDSRLGRVERLPIDWSPVKDYFSPIDSNASFEGIAIGNGKLYVANERSSPVIIVLDLATLRVKDHFVVYPRKNSLLGLHYSDLCWYEGKLWVLCRQHRVVLEVAPATHTVLAEFDYADLENALGYRTGLPVGIMEGLAVNRDSIWLATDNNGAPRAKTDNDIRPTLVRCPRPDVEAKVQSPRSKVQGPKSKASGQ
jgi:hypothetical protein